MTDEPLYRKQREALEDQLWDTMMGERLMLLAFFIGFATVALLIWLE